MRTQRDRLAQLHGFPGLRLCCGIYSSMQQEYVAFD